MAYSNTSAVIRPELMAVVEDAAAADSYYIAESVCPVWFSPTKTGQYRRIRKSSGQLMASDLGDATVRAPKTAYGEVDRTYEKDDYLTIDRGLTEVVDDADAMEQSRFFDMEATAAKLVWRNMMIAQEKRVADLIMNESNFGKFDAEENYTVANLATMNVPEDLKKAGRSVRKRGEMLNTMVMSRNVWDLITQSTKLIQYFFGQLQGSASLTPAMLSERFIGGGQILIADATYSKAKKGKANVEDTDLEYIWGDDYIWLGNVQGGFPDGEGGAARTIVWEQQVPGLFITETYRDEQRRSDVVRVRQFSVEKLVNENSGQLIKTGFSE